MSTEEVAVTMESSTTQDSTSFENSEVSTASESSPFFEDATIIEPTTMKEPTTIEIPASLAAPEPLSAEPAPLLAEPAPLLTEPFDLDIDFESYAVPENRAVLIREEINTLKAKAWLAQLSDWVAAEGQLYQPYGEQVEMIDGSVIKRISWAEDHALSSCEIIYDSLECEIRFGGKRFISLQKLPKGDEVLISQYSREYLATFFALEAEIHDNMKVYLKAKAEKTKAFQERFKK